MLVLGIQIRFLQNVELALPYRYVAQGGNNSSSSSTSQHINSSSSVAGEEVGVAGIVIEATGVPLDLSHNRFRRISSL